MNLNEARRKLTQLEHKRKVLDNVTAEIGKGYAVRNQDMDIEQLLDFAEKVYENTNHEIKQLKSAIYEAERDIEINYEEETG